MTDGPDIFFHKSVLVTKVIEYLNPTVEGLYLDVTFGSGGHTRAILDQIPQSRVIAIDWDPLARDYYFPLLKEQYGDRIDFIWGSFAHVYRLLKKIGINKIDGILADFGTSQMQIKTNAGFSVYRDTPLDMRMSTSFYQVTAAQLVNEASEEQLREIFWNFGQEKNAQKIARTIVFDRKKKKFKTTGELASMIERVTASSGQQKIHPATRVFQALRMYVNSELANITAFLHAVPAVLMPGGRVVCISFHSLEDTLVKDFFRQEEEKGTLHIITKKVVMASDEELELNPSARSAKLRAAERI